MSGISPGNFSQLGNYSLPSNNSPQPKADGTQESGIKTDVSTKRASTDGSEKDSRSQGRPDLKEDGTRNVDQHSNSTGRTARRSADSTSRESSLSKEDLATSDSDSYFDSYADSETASSTDSDTSSRTDSDNTFNGSRLRTAGTEVNTGGATAKAAVQDQMGTRSPFMNGATLSERATAYVSDAIQKKTSTLENMTLKISPEVIKSDIAAASSKMQSIVNENKSPALPPPNVDPLGTTLKTPMDSMNVFELLYLSANNTNFVQNLAVQAEVDGANSEAALQQSQLTNEINQINANVAAQEKAAKAEAKQKSMTDLGWFTNSLMVFAGAVVIGLSVLDFGTTAAFGVMLMMGGISGMIMMSPAGTQLTNDLVGSIVLTFHCSEAEARKWATAIIIIVIVVMSLGAGLAEAPAAATDAVLDAGVNMTTMVTDSSEDAGEIEMTDMSTTITDDSIEETGEEELTFEPEINIIEPVSTSTMIAGAVTTAGAAGGSMAADSATEASTEATTVATTDTVTTTSDVSTSTSSTIAKAGQQAMNALGRAGEGLGNVAGRAGQMTARGVGRIGSKLADGVSYVGQSIANPVTSMGSVATKMGNVVTQSIDYVSDTATALWSKGVMTVASETFMKLIPSLGDIMPNTVAEGVMNVLMLASSSMEIASNVASSAVDFEIAEARKNAATAAGNMEISEAYVNQTQSVIKNVTDQLNALLQSMSADLSQSEGTLGTLTDSANNWLNG